MTPDERSAQGKLAAQARWRQPRTKPEGNPRAYLVYVHGLRGLEVQVWYEPMVSHHDNKPKVAVKPEGLRIEGDPIPLEPRAEPWTPDAAEASYLREKKRARTAAAVA